MRRFLIFLTTVWSAATAAHSEFLRVDISVPEMECPSCGRAVERGINRMAGVESASVLPEEQRVTIRLQSGNRVSLRELRQQVRITGYEGGASRVKVIGKTQADANDLYFEVRNTAERLRVDFSEAPPGLQPELLGQTGRELLLEGEIPPAEDLEPILKVTGFRLLEPSPGNSGK